VILQDIGALAEARRSDEEPTLEAARAKQAEGAGAQTTTKAKDDVATGLEAFRAMLPVELLAPYTTIALVLQVISQQRGAEARAAAQAGIANALVDKPAVLKSTLANLTVETPNDIEIRVGMAILATILLAVVAYSKAQVRGSKTRVIVEPLVLTLTFIAFALGAPGTVLPAFLNASDLSLWTAVIVLGWGMVLTALTLTVLKKKSATRIKPKKEKENAEPTVVTSGRA
jgi:hypothetical protein